MAKVATRRLKVNGRWHLPGEPVEGVKAADMKELVARGYVTEQVTAAEAARAEKMAQKLAELQDKRTTLEAEIAERTERLTAIAALEGDEAKAAEKEAKKLQAEVAKLQPRLDEVVAALKHLE